MNIESANTQHPVPQNVMAVEFKLVGDLTIRQFSYLLIFSILIFIVYSMHLPFIFAYPIMGILLFMGLGFAFIPLNDISLDKWAVNYVRAITNPRIRVWKHKNRMPYYFLFEASLQKKVSKDYSVQLLGNTKKKSLEELLNASNIHSQINVEFTDTSDIEKKESEFFKKIGIGNTNTKNTINLVQDELDLKESYANVSISNTNKIHNSTQKSSNNNYQKHLDDIEKLKIKIQETVDKQKIEKENTNEPGTEVKNEDDNKIKKDVENIKPKSSVFAEFIEKISTNKNKDVIIKENGDENLVAITDGIQDLETIRNNIKKQKNDDDNSSFLLKGQTVEPNGKVIQDVIVIVKNKGGEPIRAVKSNSLGIFDSVTPLAVGEDYILEGDKRNYIFNPTPLKASFKNQNPVKLIGNPVN